MTEAEMTTVTSSLIDECYQLLSKTQSNVVWEILRQSDTFYQWNHYPKGDVYDRDTHSQYYYHAHPENQHRWEEHGHFHVFMRRKGIPETIQPKPLLPHQQNGKIEELCHLCGISMDKFGKPLRLFTTNRWVTGETWYTATDMCQLIPRFAITHAWPSWPTNIWLTQIVRNYQEAIEKLLHRRDKVIDDWQHQHPNDNVFEARELEITSFLLLA
ncbi:MAG: hypothetical protein A3F41_04885 [Coxiella sp. RIFCSPHIGHO2_12_FULL_44_14]|nr:MAG: hypothetical protein A3F41_04885 [Coxiella sp. RIFCSPHIGHO2_12_FULL_44_14]